MIKRLCSAIFVGLMMTAAHVSADTEEVSSTAYGVVVEQANEATMTNGTKVFFGGMSHANVIDNEGEHMSQWCYITGIANPQSDPLGGAGYCTLVDSDGDVLWVWFHNLGPGTSSVWGVIGGTGAWAGATGSGKTEPVSQSPDGLAFVNKSTGTITTP